MKRKKLVLSLLIGTAVGSAAVYFFATRSGRQELIRLKNTGKAVASTFEKLGEEVTRNVDQARKEERNQELKAMVKEVLALELT